MGAKIQAFDIFQTPLSSHYPLPLKYEKLATMMIVASDNHEHFPSSTMHFHP